MIYGQNRNINKDTENITGTKEILELKSTIEMKKITKGIQEQIWASKRRISGLKKRQLKLLSEEQKEKKGWRKVKIGDIWDINKKINIHTLGVPEEKRDRKGQRNIWRNNA